MNRFVWVGDDTDQPWMVGGTLPHRPAHPHADRVVGQHVARRAGAGHRAHIAPAAPRSAAPTSSIPSTSTPPTPRAHPVIDVNAHIRLASPTRHGGVKMLRRGYSFTDGIDPLTGRLDAGLFFIAFVRDPDTQFVPVQAELGRNDLLNEYIKHTAAGSTPSRRGSRPSATGTASRCSTDPPSVGRFQRRPRIGVWFPDRPVRDSRLTDGAMRTSVGRFQRHPEIGVWFPAIRLRVARAVRAMRCWCSHEGPKVGSGVTGGRGGSIPAEALDELRRHALHRDDVHVLPRRVATSTRGSTTTRRTPDSTGTRSTPSSPR